MIQYKRCSEVSIEQVYSAFKIGFSDYIIKMEISQESFEKRFFGPEGNSLEHSFIAMDSERTVGLILGGIKLYEGIKTIRCGTLCVHPEYRGKGISYKLFDLHKEDGIRNNCKQLFLEVIVGNDRAISFYNKVGYEKVYDLKYFSLSNCSVLNEYVNVNADVKEISFDQFEKIYNNALNVHINWQNDLDYIRKSESQVFLGAFKDGLITGAVCISKGGNISFLWVDPEFRLQGISAAILKHAAESLEVQKFSSAIPNNALLEGYYRHIGFNKDSVAQYEMYLFL